MRRGVLKGPRWPALALLAMAVAAVATAPVQAQGAPQQPAVPGAPTVVQAPHYGDALFHFFQQDHYAAASALMVSQHFGRLAPHGDEAEVLRGGLLLSWGLHQEASAVFTRLIDRQAAPAVRDRAWFFLAKLRHQRGLWAEAETALGQVQGPLPRELQEEAALLAAQLRLAQGDAAGAAARLQALPLATWSADGAAFVRFNLGVAWVKAGQAEEGRALLEALGNAPAFNEEQRALRDRANVALGFAALANGQAPGQAQAARNALQRVRLQGSQSNKALLGFGWAAARLKDHHAALVPWTELTTRDPGDAAVLEAHIARPYALAELGAERQALAAYGEALALFEREDQRLQASVQALREGALVQALLQANPTAGLDAFSSLQQAPLGTAQPHASHLAPLLAQHGFQAAFRNLRDLQFLQTQLDDQAQRLDAFHDLLAHRRDAFERRLPAVREQAGRSPLPALQQRRDELATALAALDQTADPQALANALANTTERGWQQRLQRAQATLQQQPDAEAAERLRRVQGALTWQLAREAPARLWDTRKALRQTDQALAATQARDAALQRAQTEEPARFAAFQQRISGLQERLAALAPQRQQLAAEQQHDLQEQAVAELAQQRERLATYAAQARLAVAQLHDRAQAGGHLQAPARGTGGADAAR